MINLLQGTIVSKNISEVTLLTAGVGYQVLVSSLTSKKLITDKPATLYIYTHVREDALSLYGFQNPSDKNIFTLLLSVSGIGPKIALTICSTAPAPVIHQAITNSDVDFFTQIKGLGKKSAQRIIIDLKGLNLDQKSAADFPQVSAALKSLGFSSQEAREALQKVKNKSKLSDEQIIRLALKNLK